MNGEMLDGDDSDLSDLARKCLRQPSRKLLLELGKRLRKSGKLQIVTALLGRKTGITADERLLADTNLWLSGAISSVKSKICDDFEYCAKKKQYPIDRLVELATVIAALVADIVGSAPSGVLLAVIVIRQGLDKLCGCDTATYYVDCALKEEEGSLKARQLLERAAEEYPYSMCALYNLGLEYHRINDHSRAEQCYRSALLIDPEHTYALHNLSHLLLSLNR
jgi:tetratricopeptide (TPR) repeat protein